MNTAICIAILGTESTGKTTLASALTERLAQLSGLRVALVPELLREWCEAMGRTPLVHEQAALMDAQHARIDTAATTHDVVICDTTAVMTSVYSHFIFDDRSLQARAAALHGRMAHTLLMALDLPWVADGLQRDGPHVREPVDTLVREMLITYKLPWSLVTGTGPARLERAIDAIAPLLRQQAAPRPGLFTRLAERNAEPAARSWRCENCDDPACEQLLHRRA
jgi:nicotinamide riboside kinase